ncbi:hypothetical protein BJ912DRAFT_54742 [Pholiota molesta]|nr:hypothetical protein BJ912DRAFT_54742 [Pholiota molesta]
MATRRPFRTERLQPLNEIFRHALARTYGLIKSQYPTEGRRKWRLRALYESWPTLGSMNDTASFLDTSFDTDTDPMDEFLQEAELVGLVVRTDFSNDDAWDTFLQKLLDSQTDFMIDLKGPADDEDSDDSAELPELLLILDPTDPAYRARLSNISNLTALRLFNDVDIRPTPGPPAGSKRISPPNPLIDQDGWQEVYNGKTLWIYDGQSNTDECARLVSQEPDFYGTATGDSWRARVTHIPDLQFNMVYSEMMIGFDGLDKYDWNERTRNLAESGTLF